MKQNKSYNIEVCVDTLPKAIRAEQLGADQIELCDRLDLDGLSPHKELIEDCLAHLTIPVKVMLRSRGGDFEYNDREQALMLKSLKKYKQIGVKKVIFGAIRAGKLDMDLITRMRDYAYPMQLSIHKAIDYSEDIMGDLEKLASIEIDSVLSSGGHQTAEKGLINLMKMKSTADNRINLIAAGKITPKNIEQIHEKLGLEWYHGKAILE